MAELNQDVGLNIEGALADADKLAVSAGEALEAALTAAVDSFTSSFTTAADAIQGQLTDALSVDIAVPVTADVTPAEGELAGLVSTVDATDATIQVDADTSAAETAVGDLGGQVESLGGSAGSASGKIGGLSDSTAVLGGIAGLATGELSGLGETATGLGGGFAAAAIPIAAVGGSILALGEAGITATAAGQRFNVILGDQVKAVREIQVGTLTEDIFKLGLSFGSTRAEIQNTAANLFQFAKNSGASATAATTFTQEVNALAARAVALRPALGSASEVADQLAVRLARGGRFAATFGLSLTAAEINTRALADTGKAAATDLTIYEKSAAAAEIATARYGDTLGKTVADGAKNAANQQKSLQAQIKEVIETAGRPVAIPLLEAFRESLPAIAAIAVPLAQIGASTLPAIATAASLAAPPLQVIADAVKAVPEPILAVVAGAIILNQVLGALGVRLTANAIAAAELAAADADLAVAEGAAAASAAAQGTASGLAAGTGAALTASTVGLGSAVLIAGAGIAAYTATTYLMHTAIDAIYGPTKTLDDKFKDIAVTVKAVDGPTRGLVSRFTDVIIATGQLGGGLNSAGITLRAFRSVAEDNIGVAARIAEQFPKTSATYRGMQLILKELAGSQKEATAADLAAANAQTVLTGTYEDAIKVLSEKNDAVLASLDKSFALTHASEAERDAVDNLNTAYDEAIKAGKTRDEALEAQRRAETSAEEAVTRAAAAVRAKSLDDNRSLGPIDAARQATLDQIGSLEAERDTLAPDSPLRVFIQGLIDKLRDPALNEPHTTSFVIEGVDVTLSQLEAIKANVDAIISTPGSIYFVPPELRAGGGPLEPGHNYIVGEGGRPEMVSMNASGGGMVYPQVRAASASSSTPNVELNVDVRVDSRGIATTTITDTQGNTLAVKKQQVRADVRAL